MYRLPDIKESYKNNYIYKYAGPVYRFEKLYDNIKEPIYTTAKSKAQAINNFKKRLKDEYNLVDWSKLDIDEDRVLIVEFEPEDNSVQDLNINPDNQVTTINGKPVYFQDGYYIIDNMKFIDEDEIKAYLGEAIKMNETYTFYSIEKTTDGNFVFDSFHIVADNDAEAMKKAMAIQVANDEHDEEAVIDTLDTYGYSLDETGIEEYLTNTAIGGLNNLIIYGIKDSNGNLILDNGFDNYENLKNNTNVDEDFLNEANERLTPQDKQDLQKLLQVTDDPEMVQAVVDAKTNDKKNESVNESLANMYLIEFKDLDDGRKYSEEYEAWNSKDALDLFRYDYPKEDGYEFLHMYKLTQEGWERFYTEIDESLYDKVLESGFEKTLTSLDEASYGGAYDIEDDMFFTKEELMEFAGDLAEQYIAWSGHKKVYIEDLYIRDDNWLVIEIYDDDDGIYHSASVKIDMRKIRLPKDIYKYSDAILNQWKTSYNKYHEYDDIDESLNEKLVEAPQEVTDELLQILNDYGFILDVSIQHANPYKNHWGEWHIQVINPDSYINFDQDDIREQLRSFIPKEMIDRIHQLDTENNTPITWNFGINKENKVTGGLDVRQKYIPEDLDEGTEKNSKGKWVNKGKEGTHGEFKTKKEADAQRKAMFAQGFKGESLTEVTNNQKFDVWYYINTSGRNRGLEPDTIEDFQEEHNISLVELLQLFIDLGYVYADDDPSYNDCMKSLEDHDYSDGSPIIYKITSGDQVIWDDSYYFEELKSQIEDEADSYDYYDNIKLHEDKKRLNNREKQIYINALKEAEDREDLEDIVHEIFFYDKALFAMLRHFPKDMPFEQLRDKLIEIIQSTILEESIKTKRINYCPHCTNNTLVEIEDGYYVCDECGEEYTGYPSFEGGLELTPISDECLKEAYIVADHNVLKIIRNDKEYGKNYHVKDYKPDFSTIENGTVIELKGLNKFHPAVKAILTKIDDNQWKYVYDYGTGSWVQQLDNYGAMRKVEEVDKGAFESLNEDFIKNKTEIIHNNLNKPEGYKAFYELEKYIVDNELDTDILFDLAADFDWDDKLMNETNKLAKAEGREDLVFESLSDEKEYKAFLGKNKNANKNFDYKKYGKYFDKDGKIIPELKDEFFSIIKTADLSEDFNLKALTKPIIVTRDYTYDLLDNMDEDEIKTFNDLGFVSQNKGIIPKGTKLKYVGNYERQLLYNIIGTDLIIVFNNLDNMFERDFDTYFQIDESLEEDLIISPNKEYLSKSGHRLLIKEVDPYISEYDGTANLRIKYDYKLVGSDEWGSSECNHKDFFNMLLEDWNIEDQIDAPDTIGKLNPGDKFKNRNDVIITIIEPTKDGTIQFKIGDEVRSGTEKGVQRMLYKNNYIRINEEVNEAIEGVTSYIGKPLKDYLSSIDHKARVNIASDNGYDFYGKNGNTVGMNGLAHDVPWYIADKKVLSIETPEDTKYYDVKILIEDYQNKDDEWGEPYTYEEVEEDLKSLTHNWTDKKGTIRCYYEQEKQYGVQILKQHYKIVEVSDGRTGTGQDMSWAITYKDPKKEIKENLDDNDLNESLSHASKLLKNKLRSCINHFIKYKMKFPKDMFLAYNWHDLRDGIEMGIDSNLYEIAEGILEYLEPFAKEVPGEEDFFDEEIKLYNSLKSALNYYLTETGYDPID